MTAAAVAALTVYDMVKGLERGVAVEQVVLLEKSGGAQRRLAPRRLGAPPARRGYAAPRCAPPSSRSRRPSAAASARTRAARCWPRLAEEAGADVDAMEVVPDDFGLIEDRLHHFADAGYALVLTTGGTGLTPDDVTPEATKAVDRARRPGHRRGAARRVAGAHADGAPLARRRRASRGRTLIVNFPGSPRALEQTFGVLTPVLAHAAALLGREGGHGAGH